MITPQHVYRLETHKLSVTSTSGSTNGYTLVPDKDSDSFHKNILRHQQFISFSHLCMCLYCTRKCTF